MWVKPKRYTALLFGSPDHYERVVFTSIDGGWGDFELLRYNGKIPRSRYVIVYDRKYAIAQSERLSAIMKNEWNYITSEFKTIIPDKNDPEFDSTKKRAKWVVIHFSAIAKQVKRAAFSMPDSTQRVSTGPSAYGAGSLPDDLDEYDDTDDDDENPSDYDDYDDSFSWTTEIPDAADIEPLHIGCYEVPPPPPPLQQPPPTATTAAATTAAAATVALSATAASALPPSTPPKGFKMIKNRSAHNLFHDEQSADPPRNRSLHPPLQLPQQGQQLQQQQQQQYSSGKPGHGFEAAPPRSPSKASDSSHEALPWVLSHSQPSSPGLDVIPMDGDSMYSEENAAPSPVPEKQQQYIPALPIAVQLTGQKPKPQMQGDGTHGSVKKKPSPLHAQPQGQQQQQQQQQQLKMQCQKQLLQTHQLHQTQQQQMQLYSQQQQQQLYAQEAAKKKSFTMRLVEGVAQEAADISKLWNKFSNHFVESWLYVHYIYVWVVALTEEAPTKEQRTKKYIVYGCLAATLGSIILHCSHGALFLVELIALNYACVYCVKHRAEIAKKAVVIKATNAKERKITRIIRAVQGKEQKLVKRIEEQREDPSASGQGASASAQAGVFGNDDNDGNSSAIPIPPGISSFVVPVSCPASSTSSSSQMSGGSNSSNGGNSNGGTKKLTREERKEIKEEKERERKEIREEKEREKKEIREEKEREKKEIREEREREKKEKEEKERGKKEKRREEKASMAASKDEKKGVLGRLKWKKAPQIVNTDYSVGAPESSSATSTGFESDRSAPFDYPIDESSEFGDAGVAPEKRAFSDDDEDEVADGSH